MNKLGSFQAWKQYLICIWVEPPTQAFKSQIKRVINNKTLLNSDFHSLSASDRWGIVSVTSASMQLKRVSLHLKGSNHNAM